MKEKQKKKESDSNTFLDADEPVISGTGEVSKEWTDQELSSWNELLPKWVATNVLEDFK